MEQLRLETGVISSVDREMYESQNQSGKGPSERRDSGFNPRLQRLKSLLRQHQMMFFCQKNKINVYRVSVHSRCVFQDTKET